MMNLNRKFQVRSANNFNMFTDKSKCMDVYLRTKIDKGKDEKINMYE